MHMDSQNMHFEISGLPNKEYVVKSSVDLSSGFNTTETTVPETVITDSLGKASFSVTVDHNVTPTLFFRVEEAP